MVTQKRRWIPNHNRTCFIHILYRVIFIVKSRLLGDLLIAIFGRERAVLIPKGHNLVVLQEEQLQLEPHLHDEPQQLDSLPHIESEDVVSVVLDRYIS